MQIRCAEAHWPGQGGHFTEDWQSRSDDDDTEDFQDRMMMMMMMVTFLVFDFMGLLYVLGGTLT